MELEQEQKVKDYNVKNLQATLFPLFPKMSGYFTSFLVKSHETEEDDESFAKFKEAGSRDLLAINRENNFQIQVARWPTECQVLPETIRHITSQPSSPELFYTKNGMEMQPKPTGDECGLIVYQYVPISAVNYFSRSSAGGSKYLLSANICPEEDTLKFESRFECGNLARAIRLTPNFYELYLRSDMYTHRYMQWFYFRVTNMKKNFLYRFSIVNFTKENSLYNDGLRPLMYSEKDSQLHSIGWKRCGDQITYYSNDNVSEESDDQHMTYTLTFTVTFPHDNDVVYFASCYPYSYSNLQEYLFELSNHPVKSTFTTLRLLCKTLAGNNVNYLTITSPQDDEVRKKRAIVLTARVHPGETPSSWMMKGIMDFLTSDCAPAKELRDKFIFKIVPMLNPDGVIVGNNRCSLSGKDLNRQYRTVIRESYPSIWYTKLMVRRLIEECGVLMYCDLHGHSRKHNMFIYGCENRRDSKQKLQEQVFPLMLHKNAAEKFSFEDCSFRVQKGREGTGRIVMWMMGITNSYTLEASFAGSTLGSRAQTLFFVQDYEQMGKTFCQTLLDFYDEEPRKERLRTKILNRLNMEGSNAEEPTNISLSDYSSDDGSSSSDSGNKLDEMSCKNEMISVPPPSPEIGDSKSKAKIVKYKQKLMKRKFDPLRKTVPMGKANLNLSLSESNFYVCSGSSSDSDDNKSSTKTKSSKKPNRRIRKKLLKKKSQSLYQTNINKLLKIETKLNDLLEDVSGARNSIGSLNTNINHLKHDNVELLLRIKIIEQKIENILIHLKKEQDVMNRFAKRMKKNKTRKRTQDQFDLKMQDGFQVHQLVRDEGNVLVDDRSSLTIEETTLDSDVLSLVPVKNNFDKKSVCSLKNAFPRTKISGCTLRRNKFVSSMERLAFLNNFLQSLMFQRKKLLNES